MLSPDCPSLGATFLSSFIGSLSVLPLSYFLLSKLEKMKENHQDPGKPVLTILGHVGRAFSYFQLVEIDMVMNSPRIFYTTQYITGEFKTFHSMIQRFLKNCEGKHEKFPSIAVIALPGTVINNKVSPLSWISWGEISGNEIAMLFNLQNCIFINDFEAIAHSVLKLDKEDFVQINVGAKREETEKFAVLAPGFGLGYSTIVPAPYKKGIRHHVWAGEGGHAAFSPTTEEQIDYMFWAMYIIFIKFFFFFEL